MGSEPGSREGTPLKAAPTVVCARTSLAVTTRQLRRANQRNGCALRLHATSGGELKAGGHTSGAKAFTQHTPPVGCDLGVGLG